MISSGTFSRWMNSLISAATSFTWAKRSGRHAAPTRRIVREGKIIARAFNQVETLKDATAHAEMLAITQAESVLDNCRLNECQLYVTKEPCPMCAGAMVHVRLARVVFGCPAAKDGAGGSLLNLLQHPQLNHRCEVTHGVRSDECRGLLQAFFVEKRNAPSG